MSSAAIILVWSVVAHSIADWLLQNNWMAKNKTNLHHPAAYVHGLIHMGCLLIVFPVWAALVAAIIHILIDTRKPMLWWRKFYKQSSNVDVSSPVFLLEDQTLHLLILAIMSIIVGNYAAPSIFMALFTK